MIKKPVDLNAFEFAVLAGLRVGQLTLGAVPRVSGSHKVTVIAQREVAEGKVVREPTVIAAESLHVRGVE